MHSSSNNTHSNNQKTVLITGCSSGIGYCVAKGLKQRGYHVIATARKQQDVERLRTEGFDSVPLDLANSDSIQHAFKDIMQTISQTNGNCLYALFNNGAFGLPGAVEDLTRENLKHQFDTNVFGWLELTNLVIPVMRKQGFGRIIQNSSVLGFVAMPFRGAYNASKYAIEGLSDTMRLELKDTEIYISLVEPGPIISRFRANAVKELQQHIDIDNSVHRDKYLGVLERLNKEGPAVPFTLPPEAVLKRVIHALEAKKPKPRYYVTFPTYLFAYLKRFLSHRQMDFILAKAGGDGKN
jgi:NAD(P)-dependent dehydrogenase (short-subunit alcohol dehydrogenase family)